MGRYKEKKDRKIVGKIFIKRNENRVLVSFNEKKWKNCKNRKTENLLSQF